MDLDKLASEAMSRGEQHFSFNKNDRDTAKSKSGQNKDQLKMIREDDDSNGQNSDRSHSEDSGSDEVEQQHHT